MTQPIIYPSVADLNEEARPTAPTFDAVTPAQRAAGRQLAQIHAFHLSELTRIGGVIDRLRQDVSAVRDLATLLDNAAMLQNLRAFGALCGRECQALQFHHAMEEHHTFPHLHAVGSDGLRAVIDKLRAEHKVIHSLLEAMTRQVDAFRHCPSPEGYHAIVDLFERLNAVVRSHFGYEEHALEDALGVLGGL